MASGLAPARCRSLASNAMRCVSRAADAGTRVGRVRLRPTCRVGCELTLCLASAQRVLGGLRILQHLHRSDGSLTGEQGSGPRASSAFAPPEPAAPSALSFWSALLGSAAGVLAPPSVRLHPPAKASAAGWAGPLLRRCNTGAPDNGPDLGNQVIHLRTGAGHSLHDNGVTGAGRFVVGRRHKLRSGWELWLCGRLRF